MKRRTGTRALLFIVFLSAACAHAAPAADAQITQVLDLLGVRAVLEQAPQVLDAAAAAQAHFQPAAGVKSRRDLEEKLRPQVLATSVARYLRDHYQAATFERALQRLQEPLAKRARYFDLAMTQTGADDNLREFFAHNGLPADSTPTAGDESGTQARRALLDEIDSATGLSQLTATLQSAIAARVRAAAGEGAPNTDRLQAEIAERRRYLAPLAAAYLRYDYRFLRDDELREYRDLMRDDAVQALLDLSRQAVLEAIAGELKPPPDPPR